MSTKPRSANDRTGGLAIRTDLVTFFDYYKVDEGRRS